MFIETNKGLVNLNTVRLIGKDEVLGEDGQTVEGARVFLADANSEKTYEINFETLEEATKLYNRLKFILTGWLDGEYNELPTGEANKEVNNG